MASRWFMGVAQVTLAALQTAPLRFQNSQTQRFVIKRLKQESTGIFNINSILASNGDNYSNCTPSSPLNGQVLNDVGAAMNTQPDLPDAIVLDGNESITFDIVDTSNAGNVVRIYMEGYLENLRE